MSLAQVRTLGYVRSNTVSVVTTVVVMSQYLTEDETKYLTKFRWDEGPARVCSFKSADSCEHFGGSKCAEADVLLGAFNFFDVNGFIAYLKLYHFNNGITVWMEFNGDQTTVYIQEAFVKPSGAHIHVIRFIT